MVHMCICMHIYVCVHALGWMDEVRGAGPKLGTAGLGHGDGTPWRRSWPRQGRCSPRTAGPWAATAGSWCSHRGVRAAPAGFGSRQAARVAAAAAVAAAEVARSRQEARAASVGLAARVVVAPVTVAAAVGGCSRRGEP
eukprot:scaffold47219_cov63-Phaeocystis_antarctica.AAC.2